MSRHGKSALAAAVLVLQAIAVSAAEDAVRVHALPASAMLGAERLRLPGGERMGLVGAGYVLELAPGWWMGPMVYGAATGRRGGLFTWGGELQRRWVLAQHFGVAAGLYAGGGGGAASPVGGGLMLRPHVDLMLDFKGWQAGLSASHVRFPTGDISSTQLGLQLMVDDRFAYSAPGHAGERVSFDRRGGIGADRMLPTVGRYTGRRDTGGTLGYVGLRLEQQATPTLSATLEAAGAASGGADGYMEALGGLSWQWPVVPAWRVGARGAVGLAGGGAVHTGGGPIAKAGLTTRWQPSRRWSVDLEAGQAKAFNGDFSARYAQLSLGVALEDGTPSAGATVSPAALHDMEWSIGALHYAHAERKDGRERPMQLVTLAFNRSLSQHFYLSGQAHSAVAGGAGAYSVGLVGLGARTRLGAASGWSAGLEALVGAAGGGGVASQGGAVVQPMAWLGRDLGRYSRLKLRAGAIKSRRGELATPVAEVAWSFEFGTP